MTDILEIKRLLASRAQAVAEHLLPGGRKEGHEWRCGSVDGEKGQSLGVHLDGPKAGVWADFTTAEGGDLLDLWQAVKRQPLIAALDEARAWLGISSPAITRPVTQSFARPDKPKCHTPRGDVLSFLIEDRNIPQASIDAYRVAEDGRWIVFPYLRDGELVMWKRESIDRTPDGKKQISSSAGTEDILFGWAAISQSAREVVLVEGEKDALSMHAYGHPALSVPRGGGSGAKQKWIEGEFERMAQFERIYLALDMDAEGDAAAEEIAKRLGRHRCLRVALPHKDANACLMEGVDKAVIDTALRDAANLDPDGLRRASDFADNVVALFWPQPGAQVGYSTPYSRLGHKLLFRPAEVTIWTGATGAGKTQILNDCVPEWVKQGSRICLSSLEMKPEQTLRRMVKQTLCADRPSEPAIRATLRWLDQGLLLYELTGKQKLAQLLEVFDYARAKYGCDQFVIDSLMRLGIAQDDYNGQERAVFELVDWTLKHGVHTHLVAHARKGEKGGGAPDSDDIKGAMEIGANAFNIISVWRNRKLEDDVKACQDDAARAKLMERPGVLLNVAKQRNGDFEGKVGLWFDQDSYRYRSADDPDFWKRRYLPDDWNQAA